MNHENLNIKEPRTKTYWIVILIGIILSSLSISLWNFLRIQDNKNKHQKLEIELQKISTLIKRDLENRILALDRMSSRWESNQRTSYKTFVKDAQNYIDDMPGFQSIEWSDKNNVIRWVVPAADKEILNSLHLFEPYAKTALDQTKNKKIAFVTPPLNLENENKGFLISLPLFVNNEFDGFLVSIFRFSNWLDYLFSHESSSIDFENYRISLEYDKEAVYTQNGFYDYQKSNIDTSDYLYLMNKKFLLHVRPTTEFFELEDSFFPEFITIGGLLLSILTTISILLFLKSNNETWRSNIIRNKLENEILEKTKIEKNLKKVHARLNLAAKAGRIGIWSWNIDTNTLIWNNIMREIYEMSLESPHYESWAKKLHPADKDETLKKLDEAIKGNSTFDAVFRIISNDNSIKYIHALATVEHSKEGKAVYMTGVNLDISLVKNIEIELKKQTELQKILIDVSTKCINVPLDEMDNSIQNALAQLGSYVDADRVYIFEYNFEDSTTSNTYEWCNNNISSHIEELQNVPLDGLLSEWVHLHKKGKITNIPDVPALPEGSLKDLLTAQSIKTLFTIPMITDGKLIGFVGFDWVEDYHKSSQNEIDLLNFFSEILVNIQLRKISEKTLLESKTRLDLAIKGTQAGLWDWNIATGEVTFNNHWAEMIGYSLEELKPNIQTWISFCHPDDLEESDRLLKEHFEGRSESYEFEARMKHRDGHWIWVFDSGKVVEWDKDGNPLRMTGTHFDITERKSYEKQIEHMATHDALTDLPTIRLAKDRAEIANQRALRNKTIVAYLFIDLDGFKSINDTYGHDAGDSLLKEVANRLMSLVRKTDTVARIGGDEFLILLTDLNSPADTTSIAEKIIYTVSQPFIINNTKMSVGTSIGIALFPKDGDNIEYLIKLADTAMYKIKKSTKNNYSFISEIEKNSQPEVNNI